MKRLLRKMFPDTYTKLYRMKNFNPDEYFMLPKKDLTYSKDLLYTFNNCDFIKEPRFVHAYQLCKELGGDLLKDYDIQWRMYMLCCAAHHATKLEGDFIDC